MNIAFAAPCAHAEPQAILRYKWGDAASPTSFRHFATYFATYFIFVFYVVCKALFRTRTYAAFVCCTLCPMGVVPGR